MGSSIGMLVALMVVVIIGFAVVLPIIQGIVPDDENSTIGAVFRMLPIMVALVVFSCILYVFKSNDDDLDDSEETIGSYKRTEMKKPVEWMREKFRW